MWKKNVLRKRQRVTKILKIDNNVLKSGLLPKGLVTVNELFDLITETRINSSAIDCFATTDIFNWTDDVYYMPTGVSGKAIGDLSSSRKTTVSQILRIITPLKPKAIIPYCFGGHYLIIFLNIKEGSFIFIDPKEKSSEKERLFQSFTEYVNLV